MLKKNLISLGGGGVRVLASLLPTAASLMSGLRRPCSFYVRRNKEIAEGFKPQPLPLNLAHESGDFVCVCFSV